MIKKSRQVAARRKKIIRLRILYPNHTLTEIGKTVGVTRERVRQILQEENLPTSRPKKVYTCIDCDQELSSPRQRCPQCTLDLHWPEVVCNDCNNIFRIRRSNLNRKMKDPRYTTASNFCNRICSGHFAGMNYGWGANLKK